MIPRGIRNNNPLNLEYGAFTIKMGAAGSDGRFATFPTMEHGICAAATNLIGYQTNRGINTVAGAIARWAPSNENNTQAYITFVCSVIGCGPDDHFDFRDHDFLFWMITAMGEEENGADAFNQNVTDAQLDGGIAMALA